MRNETLDATRGVAILLVILGHSLSVYGKLPVITDMLYLFHIPLFFIISGFANAYTVNMDWRWLASRVTSVMVPFIAYIPIWYIITSPGMGLLNYAGESIIDGGFKYGLWFLPAIAGCYILVAVLNRRRNNIALLILATGVIWFALAKVSGMLPIYNMAGITMISSYFPYFMIGYILNVYQEKFMNSKTVLAAIIIVMLIPELYKISGITDIFVYLIIRVSQVILGSAIVYAMVLMLKPGKFITWIGCNTLAIYAMQGILVEFASRHTDVLLNMFLIATIFSLSWAYAVNYIPWTRLALAGHR